jgi:hypothetical protein
MMNAVKHSGDWGVPARRLAVALSATSPRADHRAVGFPLQSLTQSTHRLGAHVSQPYLVYSIHLSQVHLA